MQESDLYKDINILIVEDDIASSMILKKIILKHFTTVSSAKNGKEGLDMFIAGNFDIVVTDIGMPFMNGLEMSGHIKKINPKTQIILTTAFDNKEFLYEAISLGINDFISKPVEPSDLFKALNKAVHFIFLEREIEEAQNLILKQKEILEEKVNERTQELLNSNNQLLSEIEQRKRIEGEIIQAKELAEKANRAKSSFLAKVSHELRTPLNGILGIASILNKSISDTKALEFINMIKSSGEGLLGIINDILDYTKIESGKLSIRISEFNIQNVIDDVMNLNKYTSIAKGLRFKSSIEDNVPLNIISDAGRLKQILMNLVGNAIKFTENGDINLNVSTTYFESNKIELLFKVKDTGIGIPKESWNLLFNSFSQVDNSLTRKHGGTGLGLSITKELVELLNGKIWLESEENVGSTFFFSIKAECSDSNNSIATINNIPKIPEIPNRIEKIPLKILLAEDSLINQKVIESMLENKYWKIVCVDDGIKAIEQSKSGNFDFILLDLNMPGINGFEASQIINHCFKNSLYKPQILAITGDVTDNTREKCLRVGMCDIVEKPVLRHLLLEKINLHIENKLVVFETAGYYNLNNINKVTHKNPNMLTEILNFLIIHGKEEIEFIENQLALKNFEEIRKISHRMKSEYGNIDALNVVRYLDLIEIKSAAKDLNFLNEIFPLLKKELNSLTQNIINYIKSMEVK
jgi:signal transduction histidine kinase